MLGTSDVLSMSHLSHRPSEPAYYIVDCWISGLCSVHTSLACLVGLVGLATLTVVFQSSIVYAILKFHRCLLTFIIKDIEPCLMDKRFNIMCSFGCMNQNLNWQGYCSVWWILAMGLADLWGIANVPNG